MIRQALQGARDIIDPVGARARKESEEEARRRAAEERLDLRWLLSDARGRRIAAHLLSRCHLLSGTFANDQRLTDRNEGRREFALSLFADFVGAAPEQALDLFRQDPAFLRAVEASRPKDAGKA